MGNFAISKQQLRSALKQLEKGIKYFQEFSIKDQTIFCAQSIDPEEAYKILRDSLIQRFEFCTDLFWKFLKRYEEEVLIVKPAILSPREIISTACRANTITEAEAEKFIQMIKDRNLTSHLYQEALAETLCKKIPHYYQLMRKYSEL